MKRIAPLLLLLLTIATFAAVGFGLATGPGVGGAAGGSPGMRVVDMDRYLRRVQEGTLSDREARWWVPMPP
mgnify:CR=1 FL=1